MNIYREGRVETAVFKGMKYKRYPESNNATDRNYFKRCVYSGLNEYLHRAIYEAISGKIPVGFDIHHIDWNPLNNNFRNLICMKHEEHKSMHASYSNKKYWEDHREEALERLNKARSKIEKWQQSEAGKKHYSRIGKLSAETRAFKEYICSVCRSKYRSNGTKTMFCSHKCSTKGKTKIRRASGIDDVERECTICGKAFIINKNYKALCCSRKCGATLRYSNKKDVIV